MADFTEAPAIAFTNIKTPKGFYWGVTMRANNGTELVEKMDKFEKFCGLTKWEPQEIRQSYKKEQKQIKFADYKCPKCSSDVIVVETAKGKVEKCVTQKYDFKTKMISGCDYTKWI